MANAAAPWENDAPVASSDQPWLADSVVKAPATAAPPTPQSLLTQASAPSGPLQAVTSLVTGALAPIGADIDRAAQYVASKIPGSANYNQPVTPYTTDRNTLTYQPTSSGAQTAVNLVGTVLKPIITSTTHAVSKVLMNDLYGDNDPDHIDVVADHLPLALGLVDKPLTFGSDAAAEMPSSLATHPAVVAANDVAARNGLPPLTKGQQVAQAAESAPTVAGKQALLIPAKVETAAAKNGTPIGLQYADHFASQQDALAGQVQDLADQVRAAGDDVTADRLEKTIKDTDTSGKTLGAGLQRVSGSGLQAIIDGNTRHNSLDEGLITDPDLKQKLIDLNDYSNAIEPVEGPVVTNPNIFQKAAGSVAARVGTDVVAGAVGHSIGGAAGMLISPWIADKIVAPIQRTITPSLQPGPLDLGTNWNIPTAQLKAMAQRAGMTPDELLQQVLAKNSGSTPPAAPDAPTAAPVAAPVAPAPVAPAPSTTPSVTPSVAPKASPAPIAPVSQPPLPPVAGGPVYSGYGPPSPLPPAGPLSTDPVPVAHPDITAANELAARNGLPPLTAGQQLARRADNAPNAAQARLAIRPYQSEVLASQSGTDLGDAYGDHFASQQTALASQVQDVADQLRAAGDTTTAKRLEQAIRTTDNKGQPLGPGRKRVSGTALQGIINGNTRHNSIAEGLIPDQTLAQKLQDLNEYSGYVDKPPVPVVTPSIGAGG